MSEDTEKFKRILSEKLPDLRKEQVNKLTSIMPNLIQMAQKDLQIEIGTLIKGFTDISDHEILLLASELVLQFNDCKYVMFDSMFRNL